MESTPTATNQINRYNAVFRNLVPTRQVAGLRSAIDDEVAGFRAVIVEFPFSADL